MTQKKLFAVDPENEVELIEHQIMKMNHDPDEKRESIITETIYKMLDMLRDNLTELITRIENQDPISEDDLAGTSCKMIRVNCPGQDKKIFFTPAFDGELFLWSDYLAPVYISDQEKYFLFGSLDTEQGTFLDCKDLKKFLRPAADWMIEKLSDEIVDDQFLIKIILTKNNHPEKNYRSSGEKFHQ